eukprot:g5133.t1
MGHLLPVLGNETVMDLGLPGTHDTLTYDLSQTVAQNANDLPSWLSWLLHTFHSADGFVGRFIRGEAQTQNFDVTQQLEAGMRFLDIRFVYSAGPSSAVSSKVSVDWYSMHMVESNNKAMTYLTQIKAFLDAHPQEVVVLFTSYHGDQSSTGTKQYPNTPVSVKQAFWRQIVDLFDGGKLLFDGAAGRLVNETSVGDLVKMGQRVVLYASDW